MKHLSGSDIQDYLDGAGGNRRAIEEHLAGCEECLVRLGEYRVLYTRLADASCLPEAPGREDAVMARIKERERGKPALWVPDLILAAAGALLAVLAVLLFLDLSALAAGLRDLFAGVGRFGPGVKAYLPAAAALVIITVYLLNGLPGTGPGPRRSASRL